MLLGTGDSVTYGGTILWETGLRGTALVFGARVLPIVIGMAVAWWALRRLGTGVLEPVPLVSLLATSLSMRVVFEEGLYGYKFMALAVMLIMVAVVGGKIRGQLVAWLALATLAFNPIPNGLSINARLWGIHVAAALPLLCIAIVLFLDRVRRGPPADPSVPHCLDRDCRLRGSAMATVVTRHDPSAAPAVVLAARLGAFGHRDGGPSSRQINSSHGTETNGKYQSTEPLSSFEMRTAVRTDCRKIEAVANGLLRLTIIGPMTATRRSAIRVGR